MGIELQRVSTRLGDTDLQWLDESLAAFAPFVRDRSAMLRLVVLVMRVLVTAGSVRWTLESLQGLLCGRCGQEEINSGAVQAGSAETGLPRALSPKRAELREPRLASNRRLHFRAAAVEPGTVAYRITPLLLRRIA